jgi:hypothetical protein
MNDAIAGEQTNGANIDPNSEIRTPPPATVAGPARKRRNKASEWAAIESAADLVPVDEDTMLRQLEQGAKYCQAVERQLAKYTCPELDTIMKLHRVLILRLSTLAEANAPLWDVVKDLMKPVMDWAKIQEQQKEREFTEQKYRDQQAKDNTGGGERDSGLSPQTLEKIELELKLL